MVIVQLQEQYELIDNVITNRSRVMLRSIWNGHWTIDSCQVMQFFEASHREHKHFDYFLNYVGKSFELWFDFFNVLYAVAFILILAVLMTMI